MTTTPVPTWWRAQHALLCEVADDPSEVWADAGPPFAGALLELMAAVEDAYALTGADTPDWEDPHLEADGEIRDSYQEEYSRCLDPAKYRILWSRAAAWTRVLTDRGWAEAVEIDGAGGADGADRADAPAGTARPAGDDAPDGAARPAGVARPNGAAPPDGAARLDWAVAPRPDPHRTTVLRPRRAGAEPLVLARTAPDRALGSTDLTDTDARILGLVLGIGAPAVPVDRFPDCGCDACDSGSRDLLAELDRLILSIVDGSFEIELTPGRRSHRTSFGAGGGNGRDHPNIRRRITAGPWAEDWTPRPLQSPLTPHPARP